MPCAAADRHFHRPRAQRGPLDRVRPWIVAALLLCGLGSVRAQPQLQPQQPAPPVEVVALEATRSAEAVLLDYQLRVVLPSAVEEAARRGVPLYFVATATLWRPRWYWRDERIARVRREWRLTFQPLTSSWRVSLGGLSQVFGSLAEALAPLSSVAGWRLADADRLDPGERYYVDFSLRLDQTQLPPPMQIDIGGDWKLGIERSLRVD